MPWRSMTHWCLSGLLLGMTDQDLSGIIAEGQPRIEVRINSTKQKNVLVQSAPSHSFSAFSAAIDAVKQCDSMLKMVIAERRLQSPRGDNHITIRFKRPVALTFAYGGGKSLTVSEIVVPLSEKQTVPEWDFYYSEDSRTWFALRWTTPDPGMLTRLEQASRRLQQS
jgi:hypothetical protein